MSDVCIVVPCFNEERRLKGEAVLAFLRDNDNVAVCFVDDGSSDGTRAVIEALRARAPKAVRLLALPRNAGKAEAVRQGMLHVAADRRFTLIGYWDADLSTPLEELPAMVRTFADDPRCALVMGSRVRRLGADIRRPALRRYMGRAFSTMASAILRLPVYDSQCGAKVIRADLVDVLFAEPFLTKWIFDVEILARLRNYLGRDRAAGVMTEVPLTHWTDVGDSKLRMTHMLKAPMELLRIAGHYNGPAADAEASDAGVSTRGVK